MCQKPNPQLDFSKQCKQTTCLVSQWSAGSMDLGPGAGGLLVARILHGTVSFQASCWKSSSAKPLLHMACSLDLSLTLFVLFLLVANVRWHISLQLSEFANTGKTPCSLYPGQWTTALPDPPLHLQSPFIWGSYVRVRFAHVNGLLIIYSSFILIIEFLLNSFYSLLCTHCLSTCCWYLVAFGVRLLQRACSLIFLLT